MLEFKKYKRIVIKIGSSLIIDQTTNKLRVKWLKNLAKEIARLQKNNIEIILVSSGAIAFACKILKKSRKNLSISEKQALAAFGQSELIEKLKKIFASKKIKIAQILINGNDCQNRERYLNMRDALNNLLKLNILPIINENDVVAIDEITFGDNDVLSAQITGLIDADLLILLSDIYGLYDTNPKKHPNAKLIKKIDKIDHKIINLIDKYTNDLGTGGMASKVNAASIVTKFGVNTVISSGLIKNSLSYLKKSDYFSFFEPKTKNISAKKKWLLNIKSKGVLIINKNASIAIKNHKSLLPIGINKISGIFKTGDIIDIKDYQQKLIAKGISNFSNIKIKKIIGKNSTEIKEILNKDSKTEAIHIDNLVLWD